MYLLAPCTSVNLPRSRIQSSASIIGLTQIAWSSQDPRHLTVSSVATEHSEGGDLLYGALPCVTTDFIPEIFESMKLPVTYKTSENSLWRFGNPFVSDSTLHFMVRTWWCSLCEHCGYSGPIMAKDERTKPAHRTRNCDYSKDSKECSCNHAERARSRRRWVLLDAKQNWINMRASAWSVKLQ